MISWTGLTTDQYLLVVGIEVLQADVSVRCRPAERRQFAGKGRRNGRARCERDANCGNYPRNAIPRATVRSIGTGWRLVQAQRAMR